MSGDSTNGGPLAAAEAARLEASRLSAPDKLQLRLLAHSLRTLQQIAGRHQGPPPGAREIVAWAQGQPLLADDAAFRAAFCQQLLTSADLLAAIATTLTPGRPSEATESQAPATPLSEASAEDPGPLALELEQLIVWCERRSGDPAGQQPELRSSPQPPAAP